MRKLFSLALIPLAIASGDMTSAQQIPQTGDIIAQATSGINSLWQRRPKRRLASRGFMCPIAPGLVETYITWSDRPLFLWQNFGTDGEAKLVVRDRETEAVIWEKTVKVSDKQAVYDAEKPLEPGKSYQWQLSVSNNSPWNWFQVMEKSDRQKIQTDLQKLEQQLKANKASSEDIALEKADYFLNYEIKHQREQGKFYLWSDALQAIHQVDKPSQSFVKQREEFIANICTSKTPSATKSQIQ
ncbi:MULTISPECIES: DUF928 domain-containing protein [Calothrix]|uniref:DUF928 domain-containing protein n=2 Tax=Calothrix TaxID=1186 RepID=A0ABR8AE45_9CYAN|nr:MULTISPECIES: DUF928 domain-containing protein [Calothrix]MBD2198163.1 DUF928 domain-containing protein [Calothrix parietina FACHB-288]MBD2227329.1 DUF928 domain-containing protein [Calothrix anomala FACHB-343]